AALPPAVDVDVAVFAALVGAGALPRCESQIAIAPIATSDPPIASARCFEVIAGHVTQPSIHEYATIAVDDRGPVARITLNRPDKRNPIGPATCGELVSALAALCASTDVRVVVLT